MWRRKYLFISLAVVILLAGLSALQLIVSPCDYTLAVSREPGRKIVGTVTADRVVHRLEGTLPTTFEYRAGRLEYALRFVTASRAKQCLFTYPSAASPGETALRPVASEAATLAGELLAGAASAAASVE